MSKCCWVLLFLCICLPFRQQFQSSAFRLLFLQIPLPWVHRLYSFGLQCVDITYDVYRLALHITDNASLSVRKHCRITRARFMRKIWGKNEESATKQSQWGFFVFSGGRKENQMRVFQNKTAHGCSSKSEIVSDLQDTTCKPRFCPGWD